MTELKCDLQTFTFNECFAINLVGAHHASALQRILLLFFFFCDSLLSSIFYFHAMFALSEMLGPACSADALLRESVMPCCLPGCPPAYGSEFSTYILTTVTQVKL